MVEHGAASRANVSKAEETAYIRWFKDIRADDIALVGGKTASLGELCSMLGDEGVKTPEGGTYAQVTDKGEMIQAGEHVKLDQAPAAVQNTVRVFKNAQNFDQFVGHYYNVFIGEGSQRYQIILEPTGRLVDILSPQALARQAPSAQQASEQTAIVPNRTPRRSSCGAAGAPSSMNCGRKATKKTIVLGLVAPTTTPVRTDDQPLPVVGWSPPVDSRARRASRNTMLARRSGADTADLVPRCPPSRWPAGWPTRHTL